MVDINLLQRVPARFLFLLFSLAFSSATVLAKYHGVGKRKIVGEYHDSNYFQLPFQLEILFPRQCPRRQGQ